MQDFEDGDVGDPLRHSERGHPTVWDADLQDTIVNHDVDISRKSCNGRVFELWNGSNGFLPEFERILTNTQSI